MLEVPPPVALLEPLNVVEKALFGAGPANVSDRVLQALSQPTIGNLHPAIFKIMDEIKAGLQYAFQTKNPLTVALSSSGHGGMEAAMCNLLEPGEKILILFNGYWGPRASDIASRAGGKVVELPTAPGTYFSLETIEEAVVKHQPHVLFVVQGESSTGVQQPIEGIGPICRRNNCLLIVDTVASLGGVPLLADKWEIDCVYSGTQKVLGAPPGLAPITFGPRAQAKIFSRKTPVSVYYFDIKLIGQYWDCFPGLPRIYHHTISSNLLFGLREALSMLVAEGLEKCIARHESATRLLYEGLARLRLDLFVKDPSARLTTITTVMIPPKLNWSKLLSTLLSERNLEIAAGLGPTAGKALRIGVMGVNANIERVQRTLDTLESAMVQCQL